MDRLNQDYFDELSDNLQVNPKVDLSHLFTDSNYGYRGATQFAQKVSEHVDSDYQEHDISRDHDAVAFDKGWLENERRSNTVVQGHPHLMNMITSNNQLSTYKATTLNMENISGVNAHDNLDRRSYHQVDYLHLPDDPGMVEVFNQHMKPHKSVMTTPHRLKPESSKTTRWERDQDRPMDFDLKAALTAALLAILIVFPATV